MLYVGLISNGTRNENRESIPRIHCLSLGQNVHNTSVVLRMMLRCMRSHTKKWVYTPTSCGDAN